MQSEPTYDLLRPEAIRCRTTKTKFTVSEAFALAQFECMCDWLEENEDSIPEVKRREALKYLELLQQIVNK